MKKNLTAILLALVLLVAFGRLGWEVYGRFGGGEVDMAPPKDFTATYHWSEGSLPPPFHWEYSITLGPVSRGEVTVIPDYEGEDVPRWTETFLVNAGDLDDLYALMVKSEVFDKTWKQMDDPPVGGSVQWLEVRATGKQVFVPALPQGESALEEVYSAMQSAVPKDVWEGLMAKREQYERERGQ